MENVEDNEEQAHRRMRPSCAVIQVGARRHSLRSMMADSPGITVSAHRPRERSPLTISERVFYELGSNQIAERQVRVSGTCDFQRALAALRCVEDTALKGMRRNNSRTTLSLQDCQKSYLLYQ